MKATYFLLIVVILTFGCTNVSEIDLIDDTPPPELVTYNNTVKAIIDNNCILCHSNPPVNGAPMSLTTFDDVKIAVEMRGLIERISSEDLAFLMPFGGPRLPQNLIDAVIEWQENGLLED
ncbi:hypothetical protein RM697_05865 [Ichthyenterobacterium sp. W332]|uniref:Cytochrome c domain-containing protein n=1 Tax=Microcosmobacter mediterraneus TaxID=3075607 RepID=A0ABU2YJV0_9FLAO|nr:hypothetical protein [Ichthyenterobacterium sp. W332]MDT0558161.1 hypothetical protein [Ichthyenterobacterium sp. W332]